jgi:hypothetical protein
MPSRYNNCVYAVKHSIEFPTYNQGMKSKDKLKWDKSVEVEMKTLTELQTYQEVMFKDIPPDSEIYNSKIVLKVKRDSMKEYVKHKARLVVLGDKYKSLKNVFAATANTRSIQLLIALAIHLNLKLVGFDIYGAFLVPTINRPVYVHLPKAITNGKSVYWKLLKTLYGLPDSPRLFYEHLSKSLIKCGYVRLNADPCVFIRRCPTDQTKYIIAVIYVDDFIVAANDDTLIDELRRNLETEYKLTESPSVESFLGIHLQYNPNGSLTMGQPGYIQGLLEEFGMEDCIPVITPISCCFNDEDQNDSTPLIEEELEKFRTILGSLIYLLKTRPDISYAVSRLSMRSNEATQKDMQAIKRILRYLKGTTFLGLTFFPSECTDITKLFVWVDAAYAIHKDRRSHSGYGFKLGSSNNTRSGMFFSRSYKQANVSLSSTESEINPIVDVATEIVWFQQLLKELGFNDISPTLINEDNKSAIAMSSEFSGNLKKSKHFIIRIMYALEKFNEKIIDFIHCSSENQIADLLTKALGDKLFIKLRNQLMGITNEEAIEYANFETSSSV